MKNYVIAFTTLSLALLLSISIAVFSPVKDTTANERHERIAKDVLPAVETIVEKYIEALGGREAIEKLGTRSCKGRFIHDVHWRKPPYEEVPVEAYAKSSDRSVYIEHRSEFIYKEGFDGHIRWKQDVGGIKPEDISERSRFEFILDPHGVLHLQDYFPGMVVTKEETLEGRQYYVVDPTGREHVRRDLYFDKETGLLARIGYNWVVRDYRQVDGVRFPFRIELSRKGGSSTYVFDEVKHNVPVDESLFTMPDPSFIPDDVFQGVDDPKVLPMLEYLPHEYGGMNVPRQDGRFLYNLITTMGYKRGLEIGTSNGYSTLWLGLAFRETGGKVITIEYEEKRAEEAQENFRKAGLGKVIDLRINDAFEEIPQIEGAFNFVFIDAWKPDYLEFWKMLRDKITTGGVITAHNVISQGNHMQDFLKIIRTDPDFETTIYETSPAGISVSYRKK